MYVCTPAPLSTMRQCTQCGKVLSSRLQATVHYARLPDGCGVALSIEASKKQRLFERRIREMDWIWRYSRVHVIVGKRQLEGWQCGTRTHAPLRPRFKRFSILASDTCMEIQRLAEHSLNKDVQELCVRLPDELWARVVSFLLT